VACPASADTPPARPQRVTDGGQRRRPDRRGSAVREDSRARSHGNGELRRLDPRVDDRLTAPETLAGR
jgi:hypothetical protein